MSLLVVAALMMRASNHPSGEFGTEEADLAGEIAAAFFDVNPEYDSESIARAALASARGEKP